MRRRAQRSAGAAVALLLVTSCGVRQQAVPEGVPPDQLPTQLQEPAPRPTVLGVGSAVIYLVERGRLTRQVQTAPGSGPAQALSSLLQTPQTPGQPRTAIPLGTALRRMTVSGDVALVDLTGQFREVRDRDQLLAVAQLVWTLTEPGAYRRVRLAVDGVLIPIPTDAGVVPTRELSRADFGTVAPVG